MILNKKALFLLMLILFCLTITTASAVDVDDSKAISADNLTDDYLSDSDELPDVPDNINVNPNDEPDRPDLSDDADIVTPSNIQMYFHNGVLKSQ